MNTALQHSATQLPLQTLIAARHHIVRNSSSRHVGRSDFPGQRTGPRRGQGLEFIDLRQYNHSDDVRHIDWNVTARSNEPYTRLYREEREHISTVIVDLRPSMFTGSECLRAVRAGYLAACILWQANHSGDRCAATVISANGLHSTRPIAGNTGVLQALEIIAREFALMNNADDTNEPPLSDVLNHIQQKSRYPGSYFFVSGFDTLDDEHWHRMLPATAFSGRMNAIMLLDTMEQSAPPAGSYRYQTTDNTSHHTTVASRDTLQKYIDNNVLRREQQFKQAGIPLWIVPGSAAANEVLASLQQRSGL